MQNGILCKQYIRGQWIDAETGETLPVTNPSIGEIIAHVPMSGHDDISRAVSAASLAFPKWADTPVATRAQFMFLYKRLLEDNFTELAKLITREHGKTLEEAKGSVSRGIEVVNLACSIPMLIKGETLHNMGGGVDYESYRYPIGVCAGITPFNFPAMIPLWMFPIALTCGNTFVLKPSPQVPLTAIRLVELLGEAGLPEGILNLVHGGKEAVDALLQHPEVRAISFVGSTAVAKYVYQTGTLHGKRVQSAGGARNHAIVLSDAAINATVDAIMGSAFGCAGERCMALSNIIMVGAAAEKFLLPLLQAARNLKVGPTDRDLSVGMGPVISEEHRKKILGYIDVGVREGAKLLLDGRNVNVKAAPNGYYLDPTIFDQVTPAMCIAQEEIFGPVLNLIRVSDFASAIEIINKSPYGNAAVIFTGDGKAAREFKHRASCGMLGVNVGVPAPMAFFPFSGWKASFFGDVHIQGREGIDFYTQQKVVMSRWF